MPISAAEVSAIIMSLIGGILILIIATRILAKWKEKRQKATLFLFVSILAWVGGCWSAMGIYSLAEINTNAAILLQKSVYSFVFAGGMFMFLFGCEIFFHFKSKLVRPLYFILGCAFIVLVLTLDSVDVQYFPAEYVNYPLLSIKIEFSIILVLYLVPILVGISVLAIRASKKLEDRVYAIGYRFIAYGNLSILAIFVVDALSTEAQGFYIAYAVLLNFTWILPIIAAFCSYLGWTLPDWFRGLVKQK
jgi:hypothetical protein